MPKISSQGMNRAVTKMVKPTATSRMGVFVSCVLKNYAVKNYCSRLTTHYAY